MEYRNTDNMRVFIGSLIVAMGMSVAGISAFNSNFSPTFLGFLVFFSGYIISQRGIPLNQRTVDKQFLNAIFAIFSIKLFLRFMFILAGGLLATWGVILFADAVINPDSVIAIVAGVICVLSYIFTHIGINGTLL